MCMHIIKYRYMDDKKIPEFVSVREFQLHAADYLKKLPIILTVYNRPVAKLIKIEAEKTMFDMLTQNDSIVKK